MGRFNWSERIAVVAILLGLTRVFGNFTGLWFVSKVGQTFAIAPDPSAFSRIVRIPADQMDRWMWLACEYKDKELVWHRLDYDFRGAIPGPHRRTVGFVYYMRLASSGNKGAADQKRFEDMTQYYFCNDGPLAKLSQCEPGMSAMQFRWSDLSTKDKFFSARQPCLP